MPARTVGPHEHEHVRRFGSDRANRGRAMSRTTVPEQQEETGEAILRERLRGLVREQPWLAVAAAAATGGVLGGIWFSRAARLVFAAATGFVAHELWHREGQLSVSDIIAKLSGDRGETPVTR